MNVVFSRIPGASILKIVAIVSGLKVEHVNSTKEACSKKGLWLGANVKDQKAESEIT
jgi:hypothetical protein